MLDSGWGIFFKQLLVQVIRSHILNLTPFNILFPLSRFVIKLILRCVIAGQFTAVDSGHRGRNNGRAQHWLYLFEQGGGQRTNCQGLPLAFHPQHLDLIHQGICTKLQQCAKRHNERPRLLGMMQRYA